MTGTLVKKIKNNVEVARSSYITRSLIHIPFIGYGVKVGNVYQHMKNKILTPSFIHLISPAYIISFIHTSKIIKKQDAKALDKF